MREILGFQMILNGATGNSVEGLRMIAGCIDPVDLSSFDCNAGESRRHMLWEAWETNRPAFDILQSALGDLAPQRVNSCGFDAVDGMYVIQKVRRKAYDGAGLPLAYYETWNT